MPKKPVNACVSYGQCYATLTQATTLMLPVLEQHGLTDGRPPIRGDSRIESAADVLCQELASKVAKRRGLPFDFSDADPDVLLALFKRFLWQMSLCSEHENDDCFINYVATPPKKKWDFAVHTFKEMSRKRYGYHPEVH